MRLRACAIVAVLLGVLASAQSVMADGVNVAREKKKDDSYKINGREVTAWKVTLSSLSGTVQVTYAVTNRADSSKAGKIYSEKGEATVSPDKSYVFTTYTWDGRLPNVVAVQERRP